jgi:prepilin-type N-terminal cleavage/methylation domain-containing protein
MENNKGFTLIEMVIVVAIMAIIAGFSVPHVYGWVSNRRFTSAVDELYVVFQKARIRAIRENADVIVRLDLANEECEVFIDKAPGAGVPPNRSRDPGEDRVDLVALPEGIDLYGQTFGQPWCGFDNRGIAISSAGTNGAIRMRNPADRYMGLALNIAGNVQIIHSDDNGATWY